MKLFTDGTDWVIASDIDDARAAWVEHRGGDAEDFEVDEWGETEPSEELAIWCDADGDPCDPSDGGAELIAKTNAQWAEAQGRGFLCSTVGLGDLVQASWPMKCRCLATAPRKCGQPLTAEPSGLCEWCASAEAPCHADHLRNAIAAIWHKTWLRAGRRWGR